MFIYSEIEGALTQFCCFKYSISLPWIKNNVLKYSVLLFTPVVNVVSPGIIQGVKIPPSTCHFTCLFEVWKELMCTLLNTVHETFHNIFQNNIRGHSEYPFNSIYWYSKVLVATCSVCGNRYQKNRKPCG